jgi:hypothetical protein
MKTVKIIILCVLCIALTSCISVNYRIVTHIDRNGSGWREIQTTMSKTDSLPKLFPYNLSYGWEISQSDTVVEEYLSRKSKTNVKVRKKFNSIHDLPVDLRSDIIFPVAKESYKKRFRWFYTYHDFTAIYPEITDKGRVPLEGYLNKSEQKFYLQGDFSAYKGMNGIELKEELNDIETRFLKWYNRSMFEESFEVIMHYSVSDFRPTLSVAKDSLYSILEQQHIEQPKVSDICTVLDDFLSTGFFTQLFNDNEHEMNNMLEERFKIIESLLEYSIQYELRLPGQIMTSNTDLQNDEVLKWHVNLFRFFSDDYTLTAESRTMNSWAFVVTFLLIVLSVFLYILVLQKRKDKILN